MNEWDQYELPFIDSDGNFLDVTGTPLKLGDKVALYTAQLFRIGVVIGFTNRKVIVSCSSESPMDVTVYPYRVAKVANQKCDIEIYYRWERR